MAIIYLEGLRPHPIAARNVTPTLYYEAGFCHNFSTRYYQGYKQEHGRAQSCALTYHMWVIPRACLQFEVERVEWERAGAPIDNGRCASMICMVLWVMCLVILLYSSWVDTKAFFSESSTKSHKLCWKDAVLFQPKRWRWSGRFARGPIC